MFDSLERFGLGSISSQVLLYYILRKTWVPHMTYKPTNIQTVSTHMNYKQTNIQTASTCVKDSQIKSAR